MMEHSCVICGEQTGSDDIELLASYRDPRIIHMQLPDKPSWAHIYINFHMKCELARQKKQAELNNRISIRRGLRWRRRIRLWQRLFGLVPKRNIILKYEVSEL